MTLKTLRSADPMLHGRSAVRSTGNEHGRIPRSEQLAGRRGCSFTALRAAARHASISTRLTWGRVNTCGPDGLDQLRRGDSYPDISKEKKR